MGCVIWLHKMKTVQTRTCLTQYRILHAKGLTCYFDSYRDGHLTCITLEINLSGFTREIEIKTFWLIDGNCKMGCDNEVCFMKTLPIKLVVEYNPENHIKVVEHVTLTTLWKLHVWLINSNKQGWHPGKQC